MRRQFITHPQFQFSFTFSFVLGIFLIFALIGGTMILSLYLLSSDPLLSLTQKSILHASAKELMGYLIFLCLFSILFFAWLGFYLSYKFVGPLYRLENWLEERLNEKSNSPINLRPGDEMENISHILNRLVLKIFGMKGHT